jgi:uncharacterized protein (DUF58 family)
METEKLLQKIRAIPIYAESLTEQLLAGNFNSVFRGQGIEFEEVRPYHPGDDIRTIDRNTSAKFGKPFIKLYREECDLTILILLDTSASMHRERIFSRPGAGEHISPYDQALLAAAIIAFSAEKKSQRIGALMFNSGIHGVFLPRKGRHHLMTLICSILQNQPSVPRAKNILQNDNHGQGSNIRAALSGAGRLLKRRSLVVLISDFFAANWEDELARLCGKHDVIALRISDPADMDIPAWGHGIMEDPETGSRVTASAFNSFHSAWKEWYIQRSELWAAACCRCGAAHLELPVTQNAAASLYHFFKKTAYGNFSGYRHFKSGSSGVF